MGITKLERVSSFGWAHWLPVLSGLAMGTLAGAGAFTFVYAEGGSYLTNNPASCANCHVMDEHYSAWMKSTHRHVAVCNDCHAPHEFWGKYATKAINGLNHSVAFTTGNFHEPIQINDMNRAIAEASCRSCHGSVVAEMEMGVHAGGEPASCLHCHEGVGHAIR